MKRLQSQACGGNFRARGLWSDSLRRDEILIPLDGDAQQRRTGAAMVRNPGAGKKRSPLLGGVCRLIEPGPVVLLSTSLTGRANVMTLSWLTMMEFEPPLVGCGNTTGRTTDTFAASA